MMAYNEMDITTGMTSTVIPMARPIPKEPTAPVAEETPVVAAVETADSLPVPSAESDAVAVDDQDAPAQRVAGGRSKA